MGTLVRNDSYTIYILLVKIGIICIICSLLSQIELCKQATKISINKRCFFLFVLNLFLQTNSAQ